MSKIDEATTRRELVDPALKRAGWDVNDPQRGGVGEGVRRMKVIANAVKQSP